MEKLQRLGFDILVSEVTAPAPAACRILKERNLRPHLLVHDGETALHEAWILGEVDSTVHCGTKNSFGQIK